MLNICSQYWEKSVLLVNRNNSAVNCLYFCFKTELTLSLQMLLVNKVPYFHRPKETEIKKKKKNAAVCTLGRKFFCSFTGSLCDISYS